MTVRGFHHVNIRVDDIDKAKDFYGSTLGLHLRTDGPPNPKGAWFDLGIQQLHVTEGEYREANGRHFAIVLDHFQETIGDLKRAGAEIVREREDNVLVNDPAGNLIEMRAD